MTQTSGRYWNYGVLILTLILVFLTSKWLFFVGGKAVGWYLRRKTSARKRALLLQVKREEKDYQTQHESSSKLSDDWEKVESYATGSATNGGPADDDWEGIVGFFHPFW